MSNAIVQSKQELESLLASEGMAESLDVIIDDNLDRKKLVKMATIAASKNPKIYQCTKQSVCISVVTAAQLGLDCSGATGEAYLVPHKNTCTLIPGYKGLREVALRSGKVRNIDAQLVYKCDKFRMSLGTSPAIEHDVATGDRGEIIGAYAVAFLSAGGHQAEWMTKADIEKIRNRSKCKGGPWQSDFGEMARKTAFRRLTKYLPTSPELNKALELDNQQYDTPQAAYEPTTPKRGDRKQVDATVKEEHDHDKVYSDALKKVISSFMSVASDAPEGKMPWLFDQFASFVLEVNPGDFLLEDGHLNQHAFELEELNKLSEYLETNGLPEPIQQLIAPEEENE